MITLDQILNVLGHLDGRIGVIDEAEYAILKSLKAFAPNRFDGSLASAITCLQSLGWNIEAPELVA